MMLKHWQTSNTILIAFAGTNNFIDILQTDIQAYGRETIGHRFLDGSHHHVLHAGDSQ